MLADRRFNFLRRLFTPQTVFLEAGYCELALRAASWVDRVYAIELPPSIVRSIVPPINMRLEHAVPDATVHVAYSGANCDLPRVYKALAPGGVFFSAEPITPGLLSELGFSRIRIPWFKPFAIMAFK
ncbi:MAG TPA: hypothetical protein VD965_03655 [Burkholderiales bacterium]|nr:hypothetical protein [Burkholderiales bacterium]